MPPPSPPPPLLFFDSRLKKCAVAPSGAEPCWELADGTMEDIPKDFLKGNTDLTGTLKLGAAVKTIGDRAFYLTKLKALDLSQAASLVKIGSYAFYQTELTGLDLSQAASLESIGFGSFLYTDITGTIETPFNVPTYTTGGSAASFPSGVTIVKG